MKACHFVLIAAVVLTAQLCHAVPAAALTEKEAVVLAKSAYRMLADGKNADAIKAYDEAIASAALKPQIQANAVLNRAYAKQRLGDVAGAVADYSLALQGTALPRELRALALYNRGLTYHKAKDLPHAIEDYTSSIMLNDQLAQAYMSRGQALRENGQLLFALSDFDRAIKYKHPDAAKAHYLHGLTFEQLQRPVEARIAYEASLAADSHYKAAADRLAALGPTVSQKNNAQPVSQPAARAEVDVVKPALPKPVEPHKELMAAASPGIATITPSEPARIVKKQIVDRIPPTENATPPAQSDSEVVSSIGEITNSTTPAPTIDTPPEGALIENTADGWAVQLASASSQAGAEGTWKKLQTKHSVLASYKPEIIRADLGKKGVFYRIRLLGYVKQPEAAKVCTKLKSNGITCFVTSSSS